MTRGPQLRQHAQGEAAQNTDNKMAFRNFANVVVPSPDTSFDALIRLAEWRDGDRIQIVPRAPGVTLAVANPKVFPRPIPRL